MADQKIEPVGCLGRALTLIGVAWLGIVVFSGMFGLRGSVGSLGALIGSTLPGLLLIGVGRTLSRRAAERRDAPALPQASAPPTTPKIEPPAAPSPPPTRPTEVFPKPARSSPAPAPETEAPSGLPPPPPTPAPKSSEEMIEEARRRWGRRPPIP